MFSYTASREGATPEIRPTVLSRLSITSWKAWSSVSRRNQSSHVKLLPTTKQQRISSDPMIPTIPRVKKVRATPKAKNDSWSISLSISKWIKADPRLSD